MRVVYVAGRCSGANAWEIRRNVHRAQSLAFAVAETGVMPLCPHALTEAFHGALIEFWYAGTLELLRRCDAMILVPGWEDSKGVKAEIEEARRLGLPIFERVEELKAWLAEAPRG